MKNMRLAGALALAIFANQPFAQANEAKNLEAHPTHVIEVATSNSRDRSRLANLGYALEDLRSDKVFIYGSAGDLKTIRDAGFEARAFEMKPEWLTAGQGKMGIQSDRAYHSYDEVRLQLERLAAGRSEIATLLSLGKTLENRDMPLLRISGKTLEQAETGKLPVVFYMGCHHAREHLSVEVPLLFATYLIENYETNPDVKRLVDSREIYIAPMVNPDGHVHDRTGNGQGRMWRKNRRPNADGTFGVDLNRNYGFKWGTGGSSNSGSSDVYMGAAPFSEPETQNVRDFILTQPRMTTLLTLHTFSELILYPWGHTFDSIGAGGGEASDLPVFEKMATTMASWNNYTPEQSSDLYITSGDTTDWAYGERGIFAFTFELTPTSLFQGGFYPNANVIQPTFDANLKPMLYLLEFANDPHRVLTERTPNFLVTPARQGVATASFGDVHL